MAVQMLHSQFLSHSYETGSKLQLDVLHTTFHNECIVMTLALSTLGGFSPISPTNEMPENLSVSFAAIDKSLNTVHTHIPPL